MSLSGLRNGDAQGAPDAEADGHNDDGGAALDGEGGGDGGGVKTDAEAADVQTPDAEDTGIFEADAPNDFCSQPSGTSVLFSVTNDRQGTIVADWMGFPAADGGCDESALGEISPSATAGYTSYTEHAWRFRDKASGAIVHEYRIPADAGASIGVHVP